MARERKNSPFFQVLISLGLVVVGTQALWQNEARFDYYRAATEARVIETPAEAAPGETVAFTGALRTDIPIEGRYVEPVLGYHVVRLSAEIYSWSEGEDDDGNTTWSEGWHSSVESNARNRSLTQRLRGGPLYPPGYFLGSLEVSPNDIRFVDGYDRIAPASLALNESGRSLGLREEGGYFYLRSASGETTIGDERLSFRGIPNEEIATYFGAVSNDVGQGRQYEVSDGFIAALIGNDGVLHHVVNGEREAALRKVRLDLIRLKWMVRLGGTLAIVVGFAMFFGVFASLLYGIPVLGQLVRAGVGILAVSIGVPVALLVIVLSIALHNPLAAFVPAVALVASVAYFRNRAKGTASVAESMLRSRVHDRAGARDLSGDDDSPGRPPIETDRAILEDTFRQLAQLANSDAEIDQRELRFLSRWGRRNGIPDGRVRVLLDEASEATDDPEVSSRDGLELLVLMALVDGFMSSREMRIMRRIAAKIGVGADELEEMVRRVEAAPA